MSNIEVVRALTQEVQEKLIDNSLNATTLERIKYLEDCVATILNIQAMHAEFLVAVTEVDSK